MLKGHNEVLDSHGGSDCIGDQLVGQASWTVPHERITLILNSLLDPGDDKLVPDVGSCIDIQARSST